MTIPLTPRKCHRKSHDTSTDPAQEGEPTRLPTLPLALSPVNVIHIHVRFVWQTWNLDHCARHNVSRALAESVVLAPDFTADPVPNGIRAIGFGTVDGRRYRAVIQFAEPDEVYVITCHPDKRGGRKHRKKTT